MSISKRSRAAARDAGAAVTPVDRRRAMADPRSASKPARRRCRAPIPNARRRSRRRSTGSPAAIRWASCSRSSRSTRPTGRRRRASHDDRPTATPPPPTPPTLDRIFRHELLRHVRASLPHGGPRRLPRRASASPIGKRSSRDPAFACPHRRSRRRGRRLCQARAARSFRSRRRPGAAARPALHAQGASRRRHRRTR